MVWLVPLLAAAACRPQAWATGVPVRVGIYENKPLAFTQDGKPRGIYVDLLDYVAAQEDLTFECVPGSWPECLDRLERGEIDLLVAIAFSEERAARFAFSCETVLSNWGQVYTRERAGVESVLDLDGRTVAVLSDDIYYQGIRELVDGFGLRCRFLELADYDAVLRAVESGEADAGVANRLFGAQHEHEYAAQRTPIIFSPIELRFAAPWGRGEDLLATIDQHLAVLKRTRGSAYYRALDAWLGAAPRTRAPAWQTWALALGAALVVLLAAGGAVLWATVRRRTAALRESEARYRAIVDAFDGHIYTCSQDFRVEYMNQRLIERTGRDATGEPCYQALHDLASICPWCVNDRVFRGETVRWEVRSPKDNRWYYVVNTPIYHPDGTMSKQAMILDITERKQVEEELRRHREELEELVAERTTELEDVNAELKRFAYSVSHDLRAPLRAMEGFSDALLEDYGEQLDDEGRDYARSIADAARRMDTLIQDLLAYSQIGRTEMPLAPTCLEEVAQETRMQLAAAVQQREAEVAIANPLPRVTGHHATLVQVLGNLLTNAMKFVAPGARPRVRVWAEERDDMVRLWVEDNGIGVAPEDHERIFGAFERLHGADAYPGTGLGLAIVRRGVERMGGRVGVESEPGKGSRFWVDLPRAKE